MDLNQNIIDAFFEFRQHYSLSIRKAAVILEISASYLAEIENRTKPAPCEVLCKMVTIIKKGQIDVCNRN